MPLGNAGFAWRKAGRSLCPDMKRGPLTGSVMPQAMGAIPSVDQPESKMEYRGKLFYFLFVSIVE